MLTGSPLGFHKATRRVGTSKTTPAGALIVLDQQKPDTPKGFCTSGVHIGGQGRGAGNHSGETRSVIIGGQGRSTGNQAIQGAGCQAGKASYVCPHVSVETGKPETPNGICTLRLKISSQGREARNR